MLTAYRELFLTDEELDERQGTALGGMRFQEDCAKIPKKLCFLAFTVRLAASDWPREFTSLGDLVDSGLESTWSPAYRVLVDSFGDLNLISAAVCGRRKMQTPTSTYVCGWHKELMRASLSFSFYFRAIICVGRIMCVSF